MTPKQLAKLCTKTTAALALAVVAATPAAQADDSWTAKWSNGHKIESSDKAFKLKFGGRIQADYTFASVDEGLPDEGDGFEFRRARLFFSGTIYDRIEFKAQYNFTGGDADIKDMYIGVLNDWGTVRFGHYKEYFSLEELTSSKYLAFVERSLPIEAFSPSRNSGIGVHGKSGNTLNWGVGVFYDADDFGVSTDENNTNVTGRVAWRPIYDDEGSTMLHIGLSATSKSRESTLRFRARPESHFAGRFVDTGNFDADGATILDAEFAGVFGPMWFAAEYITTDVDAPTVGDPTFSGYYAQFGYYLTGEHRKYKASSGAFDRQKPKNSLGKDGGSGAWEIAVRYSNLNLDDAGIQGGEQTDITVGLNWYVNPATRMMVDYVMADVEDAGDADFILWRWQVDF
jgi:phosphate-selective porin OprO/OprP